MGDEALERRLVVEACEHIPVNAQQRVDGVAERVDAPNSPAERWLKLVSVNVLPASATA